jgi:hypothetical protein
LTHDGGGENVSVIGIGKRQAGDYMLKASNRRIRKGFIHRSKASIYFFGGQPTAYQASPGLIEDCRRPPYGKEIVLSKIKNGGADGQRVDDVGVEQDGEKHVLLVSSKLFVQGCQLVQGAAPLAGSLLPIGQHVSQAQPAVTADHLALQFSTLDEANEILARNA